MSKVKRDMHYYRNRLTKTKAEELKRYYRNSKMPERIQAVSKETLFSNTGLTHEDLESWGNFINDQSCTSEALRYVLDRVPDTSKMAQQPLRKALKMLDLKAIVAEIPYNGAFHVPMSEYAAKALEPYSNHILEARSHIDAAIKKLEYVQGRALKKKVPAVRAIASGLIYWTIHLTQGRTGISAKGAWCLYYLEFSNEMPNLSWNSVKGDDACKAFNNDVTNMNRYFKWKPKQKENVSMKQALEMLRKIINRLNVE